jgi:hypothetical protein
LQRNCQSPLVRWNRSNHRFKFQKRNQLFIGVHNEPVSVVAMRIRNPDYSRCSLHRIALESFLIAG